MLAAAAGAGVCVDSARRIRIRSLANLPCRGSLDATEILVWEFFGGGGVATRPAHSFQMGDVKWNSFGRAPGDALDVERV